MRLLQFFLVVLFVFGGQIILADGGKFVFPSQFDGHFVRGSFDFSTDGIGSHKGYVSVFNLKRESVESLLPSQFGLAPINGDDQFHPIIVLWGEMSDCRADNFGITWPSGIVYREAQFYIPGVYRRDGDHNKLRTYVPRIFVDNFLPEYLGRRFFYKKILLDHIPFDFQSGMPIEDRASLGVAGRDETYSKMEGYEKKDSQWSAILSYLTQTDILGEHGKDVSPRCSGFKWTYKDTSMIAKASTTLKIHRPLVDSMDPALIDLEIQSVATYEVVDWDFHVAYYYNDCP
jgi:hypothetical protein